MLDGCRAIARALTTLSPRQTVSIVHWTAVDAAFSRKVRPVGVILGPNETPFPAYPPAFDTFLGWVRARRGPTLGICGGHQALALAHGAPIGPVFPVPAATTSYAGMPKVKGTVRVRWLGDPDPLLDGVETEVNVHASHVDEVKELPPGFRLLAIGDPCHIQAYRADNRPLYGVQFHPEKPADGDPAGARLLSNFLALVQQGSSL
ncbi:MAG: GMP synthase (glutamine-hydrolyzing) [Myxococcota bacterium]|jgi:GMP synthase (glutamine-hydrolysing)